MIMLVTTDHNLTPQSCASTRCALAYLPYSTCPSSPLSTGLNAVLREQAGALYLLGNGYRGYAPTLMRFIRPDFHSPFGIGGLNSYAYVGCDPVNKLDPSGRSVISALMALARSVDDWLASAPSARSLLKLPHPGTTWGVKPINRSLYTFVDEIPGGRRLNVVGYASVKNGIFIGVPKSAHEVVSAQQFPAYIKDHVDITGYRRARLLISYSSAPAQNGSALAEVFANETGLITEGFRRGVTLERGDALLSGDVARLLDGGWSPRVRAVHNRTFNLHESHVVAPTDFFMQRKLRPMVHHPIRTV